MRKRSQETAARLLPGHAYFCLCVLHICALPHTAEWEVVLPQEAELSFPTFVLGLGTPTVSVPTSTPLGSNNVGSLGDRFSKLHSFCLVHLSSRRELRKTPPRPQEGCP